MSWAIVPAAGRGARFGAALPKQYLPLAGRSMLETTVRRLLACDEVEGVMLALAADDTHWPGWTDIAGKPVRTCTGGSERADSVLAALDALSAHVHADEWVLVHDAARPCVRAEDVARLMAACRAATLPGLLAAPVRDTIKRARPESPQIVEHTEPRERLWRALTPQAAPLGMLRSALREGLRQALAITDEASALEFAGIATLLVEGREDNIKVTTASDLAYAAFVLSRDPSESQND